MTRPILFHRHNILRKLLYPAIAILFPILAQGLAAAQTAAPDKLRTYIFGHSLINNNSAHSAVPYWLTQLARADGRHYAFAGQYGFMPQHSENLPPISQWHFEGVPNFWDDDRTKFADADFDAILMTVSNFAQWLHPTSSEGGPDSMVGFTLKLVDWVTAQEPGIDFYIYENWPDMDPYARRGFPPSSRQMAAYHEYTLGEFHDWWQTYHEELAARRPDVTFITIPVGPVLARLLTETDLATLPVTDFYYDDAPHGTPTLYFLASLVTYAGLYGTAPPVEYAVPRQIHPMVRENYRDIVAFVANEMGVN